MVVWQVMKSVVIFVVIIVVVLFGNLDFGNAQKISMFCWAKCMITV